PSIRARRDTLRSRRARRPRQRPMRERSRSTRDARRRSARGGLAESRSPAGGRRRPEVGATVAEAGSCNEEFVLSQSNAGPGAPTGAGAPWILRRLDRLPRGASVLEFAAGSGRHARAAAERGLQVLAVDRDEQALA